jgi:hypothetical protein
MVGLSIIAAVLLVPSLAVNARRLLRGQRGAVTPCLLAKEWQERQLAERGAARSVKARR